MFLSDLPDYQKEFIKFFIIGVLAVLVDLVCYYAFLHLFPETIFKVITNEVSAKSISFVCGSLVTYNLNKYWTWKKNDRSNKRLFNFYVLYLFSMLINVLINSGMLHLLHHNEILLQLPKKYLIAFVIATGVSAMLNFIGQKMWIFKN